MALSRLEEIFHMAANDGDLKFLKKVANSKDPTGEKKTALHKASENGHLKMVKVLIHIGAEIEAKDEDGWTPLHFAVGCCEISDQKRIQNTCQRQCSTECFTQSQQF